MLIINLPSVTSEPPNSVFEEVKLVHWTVTSELPNPVFEEVQLVHWTFLNGGMLNASNFSRAFMSS
jgi:hypothetical protein